MIRHETVGPRSALLEDDGGGAHRLFARAQERPVGLHQFGREEFEVTANDLVVSIQTHRQSLAVERLFFEVVLDRPSELSLTFFTCSGHLLVGPHVEKRCLWKQSKYHRPSAGSTLDLRPIRNCGVASFLEPDLELHHRQPVRSRGYVGHVPRFCVAGEDRLSLFDDSVNRGSVDSDL